jgi:hypothetical protein
VSDRKAIPLLLFLGGAAGLLLLSLLVVFFVSMRRDSSEELCRANLTLLGMAIRVGDLPDSPKWDAAGKGRDFFINQEKWPAYQQREIDLFCPVKGTRKEIDYRGPSRFLRDIRRGEPIAADRPGNHGQGKGGNVLLKTGQVYTVSQSHALWVAAAQTTSD